MDLERDTTGQWEKRWHPLRREWVVYAAHRNARPWSGASVGETATAPAYDPECYLCPGNIRVSGLRNPDYEGVFVFENDHPVVGAMAPAIPSAHQASHEGLYRRKAARGVAKVICYDPRHHATLSDMSLSQVVRVFETWQAEMRYFRTRPEIREVLIFENRGEAVGVSNPHPHCQLYATDFPFRLGEVERKAVAAHKEATGRNLFADILAAEKQDEVRIIAERDRAMAFVPFFARYAYEVLVFPRRRVSTLDGLTEEELQDLAAVFHEVVRRYDGLFDMPFPYVMSFLQAPVDGQAYPEYHLHMLLQPPLRQPDLIKYLAGPEIGGGNFMADTMPEEKAAELRAVNLERL